jgi:hypothetical protein
MKVASEEKHRKNLHNLLQVLPLGFCKQIVENSQKACWLQAVEILEIHHLHLDSVITVFPWRPYNLAVNPVFTLKSLALDFHPIFSLIHFIHVLVQNELVLPFLGLDIPLVRAHPGLSVKCATHLTKLEENLLLALLIPKFLTLQPQVLGSSPQYFDNYFLPFSFCHASPSFFWAFSFYRYPKEGLQRMFFLLELQLSLPKIFKKVTFAYHSNQVPLHFQTHQLLMD